MICHGFIYYLLKGGNAMLQKIRLFTYFSGVLSIILLVVNAFEPNSTLNKIAWLLALVAIIMYGAEKFVFRK